MKKHNIPRSKFESSGWRTIVLSEGTVTFKDGRNSRFNIRLMADPGDDGNIRVIVEDMNKPQGSAKTIRLSRKRNLPT